VSLVRGFSVIFQVAAMGKRYRGKIVDLSVCNFVTPENPRPSIIETTLYENYMRKYSTEIFLNFMFKKRDISLKILSNWLQYIEFDLA
jgi:hypothetical protein